MNEIWNEICFELKACIQNPKIRNYHPIHD